MADSNERPPSPDSDAPDTANNTTESGDSAEDAAHKAKSKSALAMLTLGALGIVYGDIGTSPLYAFKEGFHGDYGFASSPANILGMLSLIIWALILVISIKYIAVVMRADNNGEGGILPLMALVVPDQSHATRSKKTWFLVVLGLFGCSLLFGDGMITPAISVLSALEGLNVATTFFEPYIIPITIAILCGLFMLQSKGTGGIGKLFGPIMATWFLLMGVLGFFGILENPAVLVALSPTYAAEFFVHNGIHGIVILGAVFLVVTGGETLYADMGHFGVTPIRIGWFFLTIPALLLNYLGQGAILLKHPEFAVNPFFHLAPDWALYPIIVMATVATVIASQAVISGVFSLTMAAVHFGYLPRIKIHHTSAHQYGQIYVPVINWMLLVATIALVIGFQSSSALAAAYGIAVSLDMVITDILLFFVMVGLWKWSKFIAIPVMGFFLLIDLAFFGANSLKIANGGWVPIVVAGVCFTVMSTWWRGRRQLYKRIQARTVEVSDFLEEAGVHGRVHDTKEVEIADQITAPRIPGTFVYLTGAPTGIPSALVQNFHHNRIMHETIVLLTVETVSTEARVSPTNRLQVDELGNGFYRVIAKYGFMEQPDVPEIFEEARPYGIDAALKDITFVVGRETILVDDHHEMASWREKLFVLMSKNATNATSFFNIPRDQVLEIGTQIEM